MEKFEDSILSITRIQAGDEDEINIRIISGECEVFPGKPLDIRLSLEDFARAVFGDIHVNCKMRKGTQ